MRTIIIAGAGVALWAAGASAQPDQMAMAHQMAANQLGVLEYCQKQGYTDTAATDAQRTVMARLPASDPAVSTEAAEASGRQGTLVANGNSYTLASMASTHNTTESALCKQMAGNVMQVASMQRGGMGMSMKMPPMPAMPGSMPQMPTIPH